MLREMWEYVEYANDPTCSYLYVSNDNDNMIIDYRDSKTVFCFGGTDGVKDWKENLNYSTYLNHRDIHDGFEKALLSLFKEYKKYFERANSRGLPIYFVGHSRGGALAKVCLYYFLQEYNLKETLNCITFGAPMVGGKNFREYIQRSRVFITEVINPQDIVPLLPPKNYGYRHSGSIQRVKPKWFHYFMKIRAHRDYGGVI